jgi:hypothetical protein
VTVSMCTYSEKSTSIQLTVQIESEGVRPQSTRLIGLNNEPNLPAKGASVQVSSTKCSVRGTTAHRWEKSIAFWRNSISGENQKPSYTFSENFSDIMSRTRRTCTTNTLS